MVLLDTVVPEYEVWERHSVALPVAPERALEIAFDFRAAPRADGSLLTSETRVHAVTPRARRRFRLCWLAIRPLSALIRRRRLKAIAQKA